MQGVYAFELDLSALTPAKKLAFSPASQFPASFRDISLLVSLDRTNVDVLADIRNSVREAGSVSLSLDTLRLFDIYEGKGIPEGFRSLAYTLSYRSHSRTLTDEEVDGVHNKVRNILTQKGYIIR